MCRHVTTAKKLSFLTKGGRSRVGFGSSDKLSLGFLPTFVPRTEEKEAILLLRCPAPGTQDAEREMFGKPCDMSRLAGSWDTMATSMNQQGSSKVRQPGLYNGCYISIVCARCLPAEKMGESYNKEYA